MESRLWSLRRSLDHRDRDSVFQVLAKFLAGYPSLRAEVESLLEVYVNTMSDLPLWVVEEVCTGWKRGAYGAVNAFAPSDADLYAAAAKIINHYEAEARNLLKLLSARVEPEDPSSRDRINKGFDDLRAEMRGRLKPEPFGPPKPNARQRFEQMCAEAGIDPDSIRDQPPAMQKLSAAMASP